VTNLFVSLLSALLATNQPAAGTNSPRKPAITAEPAVNTNDPVGIEYQKLLDADDSSQEAVDKLIRDEGAAAAQGASTTVGPLRDRIEARFAPVRQGYEDFLKRHPDHARARLAYGSFLNDIKDEEGAREQWEKARQLDPKNPAAWNNLANYYGHNGTIFKAFDYYAKAIELNPAEPIYYHNFAITVYLFRKDAKEHFRINEQQVFDKAMGLYARALMLNPQDFLLASDVAQTFYGITPLRTNDALLAWNYALQIARDDVEREGVFIHFARVKGMAGRFDEARRHLAAVTNAMYADLKNRVLRNLEYKESEAKGTNGPPAKVEKDSNLGPAP